MSTIWNCIFLLNFNFNFLFIIEFRLKEALIEKSKRAKRPWKDLVLARKLKRYLLKFFVSFYEIFLNDLRGEISQSEFDMAMEKKVHTERQWLPHEIE